MLGPALMLGGIGLFALLDANSKLLAAHYPLGQVLFCRFATILLAVAALRVLRPGTGGPIGTAHPWLHLLRAVAMLGSATFFFLAFRLLPLAEGYLVFFTAPFMTLALAATALGERMPPAAWAWSGVGFLGVAVALAPGLLGAEGERAMEGYLFALLGTLCYSTVFTVNRRLRGERGVARLLVWPTLLGLAATSPLAAAEWVAPGPVAAMQLMLNGALVAAATLALAAAFRHADAARLAPMEFSGLLWSVGFDLLLWQRAPTAASLLGGAIVVLACVMSERAQRRDRPEG
jgi:drug/metabolite transporter (DMT)-like permease